MRHVDLQEFNGKHVTLRLTSGAELVGHFKDNNDGTVSFWADTSGAAKPPAPPSAKLSEDALKTIERGPGFKILYESITSVRPNGGGV